MVGNGMGMGWWVHWERGREWGATKWDGNGMVVALGNGMVDTLGEGMGTGWWMHWERGWEWDGGCAGRQDGNGVLENGMGMGWWVH